MTDEINVKGVWTKLSALEQSDKINTKDLWRTPDWTFNFAQHHFLNGNQFDLDVCATKSNTKVKDNFITPEQDTLVTDWQAKYCWCNPPYSNPLPFVQKAVEESQKGRDVVVLLNADTSTKWFQLCAEHAAEIVFFTSGRIAFIHHEENKEIKGNNKGQMLVHFNGKGDPLKTSYIKLNDAKEIGS